jgi:LmbE family N-acetylglucosaminyl deacetylase/glycosyltransferase involved in cell wall biosynthesis
MKKQQIIVFAPHPDDEIIGCGGTIALARVNDSKVKVIVITDGEKGLLKHHPPQIRREECVTGLEILGIEDVSFWGYPNQAVPLSGAIIKQYRNIVSVFKPDYIMLPSPSETHADHRRVTRGIIKALEGMWSGHVLFYETIHPSVVNTVNDISTVMQLKRLAIISHASQIEQFNYENHCLHLAHLRGLSINKEFAEGFLSYNWDGSRQNFFETRPFISVIVRADNLLYLRNQLESLKKQNYDHFEVILIWKGTENIDPGEFEYFDIQIINGNVLPAVDLNSGLSSAQGEYIVFLDQHCILYPGHLELLVAQLYGNNECDIVYSGSRVLYCEMREEGPFILREETVFNHAYKQGEILLQNYIPLHTLLFRSSVFRFSKFDKTLAVNEDWEMLSRLEMSGFRFFHIDNITCEYHIFSDSAASSLQSFYRKEPSDHNAVILSETAKNLGMQSLGPLSALLLNIENKIHELIKLSEEQREQLIMYQKRLSEYEPAEKLLSCTLAATKIDHKGHRGVAEIAGRLLSGEILFSVILPVYNTPAEILEETFLSVRNQIFKGWELCLADDATDREDTLTLLSSIKGKNFFGDKLQFVRRKKQGGIAAALNDAAALARAPYLVFLDHDDLLHEEALLNLAMVLKTEKMYPLLYTDSRTIDLAGNPLHIYHKPKWSPENLLHGNYINHLTVVSRDIFTQIGGFRKKYEGAQDIDLLLRLSVVLKEKDVRHIDMPLYDWRAASDSVAYSVAQKPYIVESARKAIVDHLIWRKLKNVIVVNNPYGPGFCCNWQTVEKKIEVIIPARNSLSGLKTSIEGLFQKTDYPDLHITIVSGKSTSPAVASYLKTLRKKERIRIITDHRPFNLSAMINAAAAKSSAPVLLFLNENIEIKDRNWLMNMSKYLMLNGVGAAGATLFYPDGTLQHNGIMTDEDFIASNITTWGKKGEFTTTRNVSAVSGDCLMIKKRVLESAGGFNENLPFPFGYVDLCLSIREKGFRIVQAVDVQLIHNGFEAGAGGVSDDQEKKGEMERSAAFMRDKWGKQLQERYSASYDIIAHISKIVNVV